jgi:hypothetical protein
MQGTDIRNGQGRGVVIAEDQAAARWVVPVGITVAGEMRQLVVGQGG